MEFDDQARQLVGEHGMLPVAEQDEITRKLAMLIEGECEGLGRTRASQKYGYTRQRYAQLLHAYREQGSAALQSKRRGQGRGHRSTISRRICCIGLGRRMPESSSGIRWVGASAG